MPQPYPHEEAARICAELKAGDEDGWTYTPIPDPKGGPLSIIEIRDEDNEFVGYWTL